MDKNVNFQKYIGINYKRGYCSFSNADCFGLIVLVYKKELDIDIKMFNAGCESVMNIRSINNEFKDRIKSEWIKTDTPSVFSVVAISTVRISNIVDHVGLYIGNGKMLHLNEHVGKSCIEKLHNYHHHVVGYYDIKK